MILSISNSKLIKQKHVYSTPTTEKNPGSGLLNDRD
jgi:hypothetical protein